jgi:hypothetical protein
MNFPARASSPVDSRVVKYTVDDFNSLKKRGDFSYYFQLLMICSEKSKHEDRPEVNLTHLPVEILCYISELASSSLNIFYIKYSVTGTLQYPVRDGYNTYALKRCKVHSLKAKSSLYAVGQIMATPPINIQGVRIRQAPKASQDFENAEYDLSYDYFDYSTSNFKFHPDDFVLLIVYNRHFTSTAEETKSGLAESKIRLAYFSQSKEVQRLIRLQYKI